MQTGFAVVGIDLASRLQWQIAFYLASIPTFQTVGLAQTLNNELNYIEKLNKVALGGINHYHLRGKG